MKVAIISLNSPGLKLAQRISHVLEQDHTVLKVDLFSKNVKKTLTEIFSEYDCILGIMASGIMVRIICPLIQSKTTDPAVLVMDEMGNHIISLLSGHLGGANDYAFKLGSIVGAVPVITTATDLIGKLGIDSLARKYYMTLENPSRIKYINQALLLGKPVELALPPQFEYLFDDKGVNNSYIKVSSIFGTIEARSGDSLGNTASMNDTKIVLTPLKLVVGVGSRKGVSKGVVITAIENAINELKIPKERIDALSTAEPKAREQGILKAAQELNVPLTIVSLDDLKDFNDPQFSDSPLARQTFGVPGVSEPAALLAAGAGAKLIYRKKASNKVTVAVAVSASLPHQ